MIVELEYGRGRLPVRIPDGCEPTVLRKNPLPTIDDTARAVEQGVRRTDRSGLPLQALPEASVPHAFSCATSPARYRITCFWGR